MMTRLRILLILASLAVALAVVGGAQAIAQSNNEQPPPDPRAKSSTASPDSTKKKSPAAKVQYAVVASDGTLARGKGATDSFSLGTGFYEVDFSRDVTNCAYVATLGTTSDGFEQPGEITVASRAGNPNGVFIATFDSSGSTSPRDFHLQVAC